MQSREGDEAGTERNEAVEHRGAERLNLQVERVAGLGRDQDPTRVAARDDHRARHDAQRLFGELAGVDTLALPRKHFWCDLDRAIPQGARTIAKVIEVLMAFDAGLIIEAARRLKKTLVGKRTVEEDFAVRSDLGRGDHGIQHRSEPIVEVLRDRVLQDPVKRKAAADQQHSDPQDRDTDDAAAERAREARRRGRRGFGRFSRRVRQGYSPGPGSWR